jgi:hypothetical protein
MSVAQAPVKIERASRHPRASELRCDHPLAYQLINNVTRSTEILQMVPTDPDMLITLSPGPTPVGEGPGERVMKTYRRVPPNLPSRMRC